MQTQDQPYFYAIQGKRHGPVGFDVLRSMAEKQELGREDKVWCKGMNEWGPAGKVEELFFGLPPDLPNEQLPSPVPTVLENPPGISIASQGRSPECDSSAHRSACPASSESGDYYIEFNGRRAGPFSLRELTVKLANGTLKPSELVWAPGCSTSEAAESIIKARGSSASSGKEHPAASTRPAAASSLPTPISAAGGPEILGFPCSSKSARLCVGLLAVTAIIVAGLVSQPAVRKMVSARIPQNQQAQPDLDVLNGHAAKLEAQMETNLRSGFVGLREDMDGLPLLGDDKDIQRYWGTANYEASQLQDFYGQIEKQDPRAQKDLARIQWTMSVLNQALKWRSQLGGRTHSAWTGGDKETAQKFMVAANSLAEVTGLARPFGTVGFNVPEAVLAARNPHLSATAGVTVNSVSIEPVTWEAIEQLVRLCGQDITRTRFFQANPGADGWVVITNEPVCPPFSRTSVRWNTSTGSIAALRVEMSLTEPDVASLECDPYVLSLRELKKRFGSPDPSISEHRPGYDKEGWPDVLGVQVTISRLQSKTAPRETCYSMSAIKNIEVEALGNLGSGGDGTLNAIHVYNIGYERGAFGCLADQATAAAQAECIRKGLPVEPANAIHRKTLREVLEERIKAGDVTYAEGYAKGYVKGYADQESGSYSSTLTEHRPAAKAPPNGQSQRDACIVNLRNLDAAVQMYRLEQGMKDNQIVTAAQLTSGSMSYLKTIPRCPAGGKYLFGDGPLPSCSIPEHQRYWESCNIR